MNLLYSVSAVHTLFEVLGHSYGIFTELNFLSVGSQLLPRTFMIELIVIC